MVSTWLAALDTYMYTAEITSANIELKKLLNLGENYFKNSIQYSYINTFIQNITKCSF